MNQKREKIELEKLLSLYRAKESIINKISPQICSTIDLENFLNAVVNEVGKMMDVDRCNLMVYKDFGALKINFEYLKNKNLLSSLDEELPVNRGFLLSSSYKFKPYVLNNVETEKTHPMVKILCERFKTKSLLIVPINFKDELLAVIGLHHSEKFHKWEEEEMSFIQSLANLIAIAFKYTKMFVEKEKEVEISRMLLSLINDLYNSKDINLTLKKLLDSLNEIFESDMGCFATFNKGEKITLNIVRQREFSLNSLTLPEEIDLYKTPEILEQLKKGNTIFVSLDNAHTSEGKKILELLNCNTINLTPIILENKLYGVIFLIWYDGPHISIQSQNEIIHSVIKQISIYFEKHKLSNEIKRLQNQLREIKFQKSIAGNKDLYIKLIEEAIKILERDHFLIIEGEKGSGKEFLARLIHNFKDENGAFVILNCEDEREFEEKLFGYEFIENKNKIRHIPGIIETSQEATIFLKHGEKLSGKNLLNILNIFSVGGYTFSPSGKKIEVKNNFIISVEKEENNNNLPIEKKIKKIWIPSLNERKEEIPQFVSYFVREFSRKMGKEIKEIDDAFIEYLKSIDYPQNIDQLKEIIEKSVEKSTGPVLKLPEERNLSRRENITISIPPNISLKEIEEIVIEKFLEFYDGNKTKTAEALKIGKKTIYRKLKEKKSVGKF